MYEFEECSRLNENFLAKRVEDIKSQILDHKEESEPLESIVYKNLELNLYLLNEVQSKKKELLQ